MEDPGWSRVWSNVAWGLIPLFGLRRLRRVPGIQAIRSLFMSFVGAVLLFEIVLSTLSFKRSRRDLGVGAAVAIVAVVGVVSIVAVLLLRRRDIDSASASTLAESYRSNFFLKMASSEFVALAAFVLTFVAASQIPYRVGLVFALVAFGFAVPSRADVARRQDEVRLRGSPLSLLDALQTITPARGS